MARDDIEIEELRSLLDFNPETGELTWKVSRSRVKRGDLAGRIGDQGYVTVGLRGGFYRGHRLGFAIHYGRWASGLLDHINRNRSDNRICNLRECTNAENLRNTGLYASNRSGRKGAYFDKTAGKWRALIRVSGKKIYLGYFDTVDAAGDAYDRAAIEHFGEFALPLERPGKQCAPPSRR